ncbi:MAG: hypothetical protein Q9M91_01755 [Candidatus Dojkabacteria bacterium]|nr:hypothetical protein [Candidatus Dojkabacteria bacterium]MDQ7020549.1 hypothetical protein [Candidatus Dojkabacteria bacterium]
MAEVWDAGNDSNNIMEVLKDDSATEQYIENLIEEKKRFSNSQTSVKNEPFTAKGPIGLEEEVSLLELEDRVTYYKSSLKRRNALLEQLTQLENITSEKPSIMNRPAMSSYKRAVQIKQHVEGLSNLIFDCVLYTIERYADINTQYVNLAEMGGRTHIHIPNLTTYSKSVTIPVSLLSSKLVSSI